MKKHEQPTKKWWITRDWSRYLWRISGRYSNCPKCRTNSKRALSEARPRNIAECPFFGHRRPASAAECCWASIRASNCWWLGASIGLGFQDSTVSKYWESWNMVPKMLWEKMGTACLDTENTPDPSTASTRKSNTQVFAVVKGLSNKFVIEKLCPSKWNMCSNRWVVDDQERLH